MEEILYQYNPWWEDSVFSEGLIPRERYLGRLIKYLDNKNKKSYRNYGPVVSSDSESGYKLENKRLIDGILGDLSNF